jgi:hypothetical protein
MATYTYAGEHLKNGNIREVAVYENTWNAVTSVSTNYGDIEATTASPLGYYDAPVKAGDALSWYTSADYTVQKVSAADDGNLLVGFAVDNPHGTAGGTRRVKAYFLAPGDIVLLDCDATHTAIAVGDAIDVDALSATSKHGITANKTGGTGFGYALDVLALNTAGTVRIQFKAIQGA